MQTVLPNRFSDRILPVAIAVVALVCEFLVASGASARPGLVCESEAVLATGPVDPSLFAAEASKNVRAFWCERYDANGSAMRAGPYWEIYASGRTRTQAL
ncbi:MAG: hypothetical protein ABGY42_03470, partial [bacterium]